MVQKRAVVQGLVQGVGFRYHTRRVAQQLGLTGFVRNLADGTVELVAVGPEPQVEALLAWAHQGPAAAQVTRVAVSPYEGDQGFDDFSIDQ